MPLESATYLNGLNATYPLGSDTVASLDDHIRLIKSVLKATFPNVSAAVTVTASDLNTRGVPSGFIGLWSGAASAIPSGWFLCDGTNGTPNLRDRFVVGAGGSYAVGATGGTTTATSTPAGSHTPSMAAAGTHSHSGVTQAHTLTVDEIPPHTHAAVRAGIPYVDYDDGQGLQVGEGQSGSTGGGQGHSHGITADGSHTHSMNPVGDHTHTVDTRSPYYALCYIMKA